MQNKATFLGVFIAIATVGAIIGAAMLSSSGSNTSGGDSSLIAATGAPSAPIGEQNRQDNLPATNGDGSSIQSQAGSGGVGGTAGGSGGTGVSANSSQIIDRKIERTSTLSVTVGNVFDAVNRIQAAATGAGGYVSQENITETAGPDDQDGKPTKQQQATVQIRVPSESYDAVMSGLRGIATEVTSENSQTTEVTAQYTDLQAQLRNLQATETQYLALLERAGTIDEILTVGDRLASVRLQIEQVQGQINLLDNLTSLATITINVSLPPIETILTVETVKEPNFARQALDDAWQASQDVLEFMAVAAITAGVIMVWILVPGVLLLAGWRLLGGRRHGPAAS